MASASPARSRTTFRFGPAPTKPLHSRSLTSDTRQDWRLVHRVAKDHEAAILKATLEGFARARALIDPDKIGLEIHQVGHPTIDWAALGGVFGSAFLPAIVDTGRDMALKALPSFKAQVQDAHPLAASEKFDEITDALDAEVASGDPPALVDTWTKLGFDLQHQGANSFLSWYTPDKITGVTSQIRDVIGSVIQGGFKNGVDVYYQANAIKYMVGLSGPQAVAYSNRADFLRTQGFSNDKVQSMMESWSQKAIKYRATVIARTESLRAANQGQKVLWEDAQHDGLLDPSSTSQVWIATPDDRECEICSALDGKTVDLDGSWTSNISGVTEDSPPIHTSCRCAMGLDFSQSPTPGATPQEPTPDEQAPTGSAPTPGASIGDVDFPNYMEDVKYAPKPSPYIPGAMSYTHEGERFLNKIEGPEWVNWAANETDQEARDSLRSYTSNGYRGINDFFRSGIKGSNPYVTAIDRAFSQVPGLPSDIDLFRNVNSMSIQRDLGVDLPQVTLKSADSAEKLAEGLTAKLGGTVISDKAYMSATVDPEAAFSGRPVQYVIETPKGAKVIYLDQISQNSGEVEALFPHGSKLQIKKFEFVPPLNIYAFGTWRITVRLLLPPTP